MPFTDIDVKGISLLADQYTTIANECERNLPKDSSAVNSLKKMVREFRETMPIIESLDNKNLHEEHWKEII